MSEKDYCYSYIVRNILDPNNAKPFIATTMQWSDTKNRSHLKWTNPVTNFETYQDETIYDDLGDDCARCHGEGWIYESEGDPSDWMEDTYCGSDDSVIECRVCNGTGVI